MNRRLVSGLLALVLASGTLSVEACAPPEDQAVDESTQDLSGSENAAVVRKYYAAMRAGDPAGALAPIVDEGAILSAPSIKMLKGVAQLEGKANFIEGAAGGAFLLKNATVREIIGLKEVEGRRNLVVARIDLPLPKHGVLTQVEFFEMKNGKIVRLDSYYDAIKFAAALPAIGVEKVKAYFDDMSK